MPEFVRIAIRDLLIFTATKPIKRISIQNNSTDKGGLRNQKYRQNIKNFCDNSVQKNYQHCRSDQSAYTQRYQSYELDEMRFFIRKKSNPQWLVYAIDRKSKMVAGFYIGNRTNRTLNAVITTLINSDPQKIYTDKLMNYQYLIPKKIHQTTRFGTNGIERKNLSIRTHLKRMNRRTICFSKNILILISILKIYFWT